ncbi:hypothetical protein [Candidatus Nitrosocosmicus sp. FF01]|uniref:hypothetical protein n=1 Tax=Candidatus Nitrosocosmicus sp. FF01 TaxID=3397670 RepID=UPI0039E98593
MNHRHSEQYILYFIILILVFIPFLIFSPSIVSGSGNDVENESISNKTSFYSCQDYRESVQCALSKNEFEGYSVDSTSDQITPITREPNYVEGKNGSAVEFRDKFRDFVEMSNITAYQSDEFSISFWVKKIVRRFNLHQLHTLFLILLIIRTRAGFLAQIMHRIKPFVLG